MTREQWGSIVSNMISRGAKGSDEEFAQVVDYLAQTCPRARRAAAGASKAKPRRRPSLIDEAGPNDKQVIDEDAARARKSPLLRSMHHLPRNASTRR